VAQIHQRQILGRWRQGFALDIHTVASIYLGDDEFGHPRFENTRSEIGELLYRLKYNRDQSVVDEIAEAAAIFVRAWRPSLNVIVPVPPSTIRSVQPVHVLASALGQKLGIPVAHCVTTARDPSPLKNVNDLDERMRLLTGLYAVDTSATTGRSILLFDDLYRSGATMNEITTTLFDQGHAADVFALTITRTRSMR
jgi:competence protein ComFC